MIDHFLRVFGRTLKRPDLTLAPEVRECLLAHDWPGNVRQLQSVLKYAMIKAVGDTIGLDCLPEKFPLGGRCRQAASAIIGWPDAISFTENLLRAGETEIYRRVALEVDRAVLGTVLRHVKGNQVQASELLGISRTTLESETALPRQGQRRADDAGRRLTRRTRR